MSSAFPRARQLLELRKFGLGEVVLAAGMRRSGSTLLFNILRLCLEQDRPHRVASGWIDSLQRDRLATTYLAKCHKVPRLLAWRSSHIFYTYRDVRTVLVSLERKFGWEPTLDRCDKLIREDVRARRYADRRYSYEQVVENTRHVIEDVAAVLRLNPDVAEVERQLPAARVDGTGFGADATTMLHGGHATGTSSTDWHTVLPRDLRNEIAHRYSWWFCDSGYPLE
jgi:hypothetical protein